MYRRLFTVTINQAMVLEWDIESGAIIEYPLMGWINDMHYLTRTLVITGDSDKGKTQIAKAMLARLADEKQTGLYPRPYMVVVQTVEGLGAAAAGGWCHEWVCLLLDEIRPGQNRGTRAAMSADEVKKLCTVDIQVTVDARGKDTYVYSITDNVPCAHACVHTLPMYKDLQLAVNQPRIVTANAMRPGDWHQALPDNLYTVDNNARLSMHPDTKAIGKRIAWAFVDVSLIPQGMRDAYNRRCV